MFALHDFQGELVESIYDKWGQTAAHLNGVCRNVLAVLPTGGGKTVVVSHIVKANAGPTIVIAHRQELVQQMSKHLAEAGIAHNIIAPRKVIKGCVIEHMKLFGQSFYNPTSIVKVAGVDSLIARSDQIKSWAQQITLWVIDEAHHVIFDNKWGKAVALFPNARGLGVTATPKRSDRKALGADTDGVFHALCVGPSLRELIDRGFLTDYEVVIPVSDYDLNALTTTAGGDYSQKSAAKETKRSQIVGDIVSNYCTRAYGKQCIVFTTDIESAEVIAQKFRDVGISAASINGTTPSDKRIKLIEQFKDKEITVLVNVDLFGEGFDVPAVEVIIMARPTKSLGLFLQQCGRALRKMDGKSMALIIDHVSNFIQHGLPCRPRFWSLAKEDGRRKSKPKDDDDLPLTTCLNNPCRRPYEVWRTSCPHCGHVPTPEGRSTPEQVSGDLMLLDLAALDALRAATILEAPSDLAARVGMVAGKYAAIALAEKQVERIASQNALKESIALWAGRQRDRGRTDSESYRIFYQAFDTDVASSLGLKRVEMDDLIERVDGYGL